MINTTTIPCRRSAHTPYQIELYSSPLIITVGDKYTISVYGIPCPRAAYLGNALFITESIFFRSHSYIYCYFICRLFSIVRIKRNSKSTNRSGIWIHNSSISIIV